MERVTLCASFFFCGLLVPRFIEQSSNLGGNAFKLWIYPIFVLGCRFLGAWSMPEDTPQNIFQQDFFGWENIYEDLWYIAYISLAGLGTGIGRFWQNADRTSRRRNELVSPI
jgi:hypothetical protein